MNRLGKQISDLRNAIEVSRDNHEHRIAIEAYEAMMDQCKPRYELLLVANAERNALGSDLELHVAQALQEDENEKLDLARSCLDDLKQAWSMEDHRVKQNIVFGKVLSSLDSYSSILLTNTRITLKEWIAERDADLFVPEPALETQRRMPGLKQIIDQYERAYSVFKEVATKRLDSSSAEELLRCIRSIASAKEKMIFDLPEQVKRFFDALHAAPTGGGAPLNLLTEEVISWLEQHRQTANYVIRRKGQSAW